ncbi:MAG: plastocyanin [Chloroflexi bacterium]|nr:plastocyanin [Chloroflexota bacterium]
MKMSLFVRPMRGLAALAVAGALTLIAAAGCTGSTPAPASSSPAPAAAPAASPASGAGTQPPAAVSPTPGAAPPGAATPASTADTPDRPTAIHDVYIQGAAFRPANLTVQVGSVVLWSNQDPDEHTVVGPGWELGPMANKQAWAHTFKTVGTEAISSRQHPEMKMTVTVTEVKK